MSVYQLKPAFQDLLRPLCRALARGNVTANQVTVAAVLLSAAAGACIGLWSGARWPLLLLPVALFARMALNAVDGMLAREHDMKSASGAVLNELGDVVSDAVLYLPLARVSGFGPWPIFLVVLLSVVSEMAGVVAVQIGASRRYDGPMGKSDRAFVFGVVSVLAGLGVPAGRWIATVLWVVAGLLAVTILNRSRRALQEAARLTAPGKGQEGAP